MSSKPSKKQKASEELALDAEAAPLATNALATNALTIAFSLPFDGVPKGGHHAIERFWARRKQRSHC